jgi:uncharacterized protein YidB (DUF937 family)
MTTSREQGTHVAQTCSFQASWNGIWEYESWLINQNGHSRERRSRRPSSGGLDVLLNQFKQSGLGDINNSWIGTGQNQPISPTQLREAIGQRRKIGRHVVSGGP